MARYPTPLLNRFEMTSREHFALVTQLLLARSPHGTAWDDELWLSEMTAPPSLISAVGSLFA